MDRLENWCLVACFDSREKTSSATLLKPIRSIRRIAESLVDTKLRIIGQMLLTTFCLEGQRNVEDGHKGSAIIKTPPIISRNVDCTAVLTRGGAWYQLGEPDPKSTQRVLNLASKFLASLPITQNPVPLAKHPEQSKVVPNNIDYNVPVG